MRESKPLSFVAFETFLVRLSGVSIAVEAESVS